MKTRVPAPEATRKRIAELLNGDLDKSALMREAMPLRIEETLEAEVTEGLRRPYYGRSEAAQRYRNGIRMGRLKTAEGLVEYAVPQVTGTETPWHSEVREALAGRIGELERLAIERYARGLSMRDIERTFTDATGHCVLTKTAASEVAERLWEDYQTFATRDLSASNVLYLFLDGVHERLHLGQPREAVLCARGITATGAKVLLGLSPGTKEDTASAKEFLRDLKTRGLKDPVLVATDGAPGLIRAVTEVFPRSLRQRCLTHQLRNLEGQVPGEFWREVKAYALAAYQASSPTLAQIARDEFVQRFGQTWPAATACFEDDFEACIAQLKLPIAHRPAIRTTHLRERLFGEERRRSKVIPHAFGERPVLKLMYAALIRASPSWRRILIQEFEQKQIEEL